jgi:nucleoside-diphosphate-sugar epimerase
MNILIAGGAGFLGSNFARYFLEQGHSVVVVDNLITGEIENIHALEESAAFTFVEGDICNDELIALLGKTYVFDRIYDFACPTGVPNIAAEKLGEQMLDTCTMGVRNLLNLARVQKAKFFHASSAEVYGEPEVSPQHEDYTGNVHPLGFRAPYEEGKRVAESYVRLYVQKYGVDAKIVRFFNAYGPNYVLHDTRVISTFIRQALLGESLTIQGEGLQNRTFCYVDDVISGVELVMEHGVPGEAYNIGGTEQITIKTFAEHVLRLTESSSKIVSVPRPTHDHSGRLPDTSKARALGWQPNTGLEEGLLRTIAHFKHRLAVNA